MIGLERDDELKKEGLCMLTLMLLIGIGTDGGDL